MEFELLQKISGDITTAMKNKEKEKLDALRYLKSMLIENKTAKAPKDELEVVIALVKKLKDSLLTYPEGHELRIKMEKEITFVSAYGPSSISEEDVKKLILEIKAKMSAPNMGLVMKELSPHIKGRFDGKRANDLVKELL
jgi:uncharacterized protein YqeY